MDEIELKLQVPPERAAAVERAVAGRGTAALMRLQAAYFDTPDRRLAEAGLALRLRREGRQWVQTLKGAGDDGLTRTEHNVARGAAAARPAIEPALHAGFGAGDRLLALLAGAPPLQTLYRTDIRRRRRALAVRAPGRPAARVELAFDRGRIETDAQAIEVCELEVELLAGAPLAVIDHARRWQQRFGLWLDGRSKAERGDLLARGARITAPRRASGMPPAAPVDDDAALWQAVLRNVAEQVLANASQVASGDSADEHVHQLRVGLRRLRSALALFEVDAPALVEGSATLFRALGAARDAAVLDSAFGAELEAALRGAGLAASLAPPPAGDAPPPAALLRRDASQALLFDLLAAMQPATPSPLADAPPLRERLVARLKDWHRRLVRDARRFAKLDDAARHRLRKHVKRQRYAAEFCAPLFPGRALRRYLKVLGALQTQLGELSDVTMAMQAFAARAEAEPAAMFAAGWLAARRAVLVEAAAPALARFAEVERFWKKGRRA